MKGLELPVNILIIVVIAIIVLIAVVAMFYPAFSSGSDTVSSDVAKTTSCQLLIDRGCGIDTNTIPISNFDADKDSSKDPGATWEWGVSTCNNDDSTASNDNLAALCDCYYSLKTESACMSLCGC